MIIVVRYRYSMDLVLIRSCFQVLPSQSRLRTTGAIGRRYFNNCTRIVVATTASFPTFLVSIRSCYPSCYYTYTIQYPAVRTWENLLSSKTQYFRILWYLIYRVPTAPSSHVNACYKSSCSAFRDSPLTAVVWSKGNGILLHHVHSTPNYFSSF